MRDCFGQTLSTGDTPVPSPPPSAKACIRPIRSSPRFSHTTCPYHSSPHTHPSTDRTNRRHKPISLNTPFPHTRTQGYCSLYRIKEINTEQQETIEANFSIMSTRGGTHVAKPKQVLMETAENCPLFYLCDRHISPKCKVKMKIQQEHCQNILFKRQPLRNISHEQRTFSLL